MSLEPSVENLWYEGAVVAEGKLTKVDFDLSSRGTISGTVTSATATPVANAHLRIFRSEPFGKPGYAVGFAITDESGHYAIHGLDPGTYTVALSLQPTTEDLWHEGVIVTEGKTATVDFDLRR